MRFQKIPSCSKEELRVVLYNFVQKKWHINAIDMKNAFLRGQKIDRELFAQPPKGANTNKL